MRNPPPSCAANKRTIRTCPGKKHVVDGGHWCCDICGVDVPPPAGRKKKPIVAEIDKKQTNLITKAYGDDLYLTDGLLFPRGTAVFSADSRYRYRLDRKTRAHGGSILWIELKASMADFRKDDAPMRRMLDLSERWGYGTVIVGSLFAYRTKQPKVLGALTFQEAVGVNTDAYLMDAGEEASRVVVAWGCNFPRAMGLERVEQVLGLLQGTRSAKEGIYCAGVTKDGHPRHPGRLEPWKSMIEYLP